jgi:DNA-binding PadR family transcriptional regulator
MSRSASRVRVDSFLPLPGVAFEILMALADGDAHGYAILQEVERRTDGRIRLLPGSLYRSLARLVETGLIVERAGRPEPDDDERRRYYAMTGLGRQVAEAEARRLLQQVRSARQKKLLKKEAL